MDMTFKNERFGVSFTYRSSFTVTDISYANDFKVVASSGGAEFTITAIPSMQGHTAGEYAKFIHDSLSASKPDQRIPDVATYDLPDHKIYAVTGFYGEGSENKAVRILLLDMPFAFSNGIMLKTVAPYDPATEKRLLQPMLDILGSLRTTPLPSPKERVK